MLFHLSVLSFLMFPLGNVIIPLILWLTKKDKIVGLNEIGARLLNFQILWTVLFYTTMIAGALGKLLHTHFEFFLLAVLLLPLFNIILSIVFVVKTNKGSVKTYYQNFNWLRIIR